MYGKGMDGVDGAACRCSAAVVDVAARLRGYDMASALIGEAGGQSVTQSVSITFSISPTER